MKPIEVGCTVAYARQFLRNAGINTGAVPFMRGTVTKLAPLGSGTLATVQWTAWEETRVLVSHLVRADCIHLERV